MFALIFTYILSVCLVSCISPSQHSIQAHLLLAVCDVLGNSVRCITFWMGWWSYPCKDPPETICFQTRLNLLTQHVSFMKPCWHLPRAMMPSGVSLYCASLIFLKNNLHSVGDVVMVKLLFLIPEYPRNPNSGWVNLGLHIIKSASMKK